MHASPASTCRSSRDENGERSPAPRASRYRFTPDVSRTAGNRLTSGRGRSAPPRPDGGCPPACGHLPTPWGSTEVVTYQRVCAENRGQIDDAVRRRWQPQVRRRRRKQAAATGITVETRARFGYTAPVGTTDDGRFRRLTLRLPPEYGQRLFDARDTGPATRRCVNHRRRIQGRVFPGRWCPRHRTLRRHPQRHRLPRPRPRPREPSPARLGAGLGGVGRLHGGGSASAAAGHHYCCRGVQEDREPR